MYNKSINQGYDKFIVKSKPAFSVVVGTLETHSYT